MNKCVQLEFFPLSKEQELEYRVESMEISQDKIRKKLFAQQRELQKMYMDLNYEFEQLKASICRCMKK